MIVCYDLEHSGLFLRYSVALFNQTNWLSLPGLLARGGANCLSFPPRIQQDLGDAD